MNVKKSILVLMVFLFLPLVYADLIPSTAPCWYKGTVTGSGISVEGLTVEAYQGSTLLKSGVISSGLYELNSIGANDGDTITFKVYGAPFATSTFLGYCKTGDDPWIVEDFTVSKQANGVSCSNNAICTSNNCASGVCSVVSSGSNSGGGGLILGSTGGFNSGVLGSFVKKIWVSINKGESATVILNDEVIGITGVYFIVKETTTNVWVRVAIREDLPSDVQQYNKKYFQYLEVTKSTFLTDELVSDGKIDFKVPKSWLLENSLPKEKISMFRYNEGNWDELTSTITGEDDTNVFYSTTTPGFSFFVIGENSGTVLAPVEEVDVEEPVPEELSDVEPELISSPTDEETLPSEDEAGGLEDITGAVIGSGSGFTTVGIIILLVLVIAGLVIFTHTLGGLPGTNKFSRAANFHKRAQRAHNAGKYKKAQELYKKAEELREN